MHGRYNVAELNVHASGRCSHEISLFPGAVPSVFVALAQTWWTLWPWPCETPITRPLLGRLTVLHCSHELRATVASQKAHSTRPCHSTMICQRRACPSSHSVAERVADTHSPSSHPLSCLPAVATTAIGCLRPMGSVAAVSTTLAAAACMRSTACSSSLRFSAWQHQALTVMSSTPAERLGP